MPVRQKSWGLPVRPPDRTATINPDENELEQQSTEAAVKYWLSEAEKLQPEQRLLFERGAEADSYEDYVSGLTRAVQNTTNSSKVSRLSRKMKPVYALVKSVAPLVASADQASPFPPSLVIGGITCILSASNRVDDYQSKLIENMEGMVDEIDSINQYRREGIFQDDPGIKACELNLATDIFQFCVRVVPIFYDEKGKERNGLSVAMKVQFKDFDTKFGDIMAHFKQHLRALENRRGLINNRWTKETHLGVKEMGLLMEQDSQDKKEAMEEKLRQHRQAEDNERGKASPSTFRLLSVLTALQRKDVKSSLTGFPPSTLENFTTMHLREVLMVQATGSPRTTTIRHGMTTHRHLCCGFVGSTALGNPTWLHASSKSYYWRQRLLRAML